MLEHINDNIEYYIQSSVPLQFLVLLHSEHWFAGEILVDKKSEINISILDSLGESRQLPKSITKKNSSAPQINLYASQEKTQPAGIGCSLFAIETSRKLFVAGAAQHDLRDPETRFLRAVTKVEVPVASTEASGKSNPIQPFHLPPTFLRMSRDVSLLEDPEMQDVVVSKSGKTFGKSVEETLKSGIHTKSNHRLLRKMQNLELRAADFLIDLHKNGEADKLHEILNRFTLKGYINSFGSNPIPRHKRRPSI